MHRGKSRKPAVVPARTDERTWERLIHSALVRQFQTAFTRVTGLRVTLISARAPGAEFCTAGCADPSVGKWCEHIFDTAKRKAVGDQRCLQYKCPAGLTKIVVPVSMGEKQLGAMLVGPYVPHTVQKQKSEDLRPRLKMFRLENNAAELKSACDLCPSIGKEKARSASQLVQLFAQYLAESANRICLEDAARGSRLLKRVEACVGKLQASDVESRDVARRLKLSPCYFCKLFKRQTGMTFSEYRARQRVEKARQLLLNHNVRIGEVADACGFRSLPCFIRAFRKHQGYPPSQYRRQHRFAIPDNKTPIQA